MDHGWICGAINTAIDGYSDPAAVSPRFGERERAVSSVVGRVNVLCLVEIFIKA